MVPYPVVELSPSLHQHLGLCQGVEDLPVEQLIAQLADEGLHLAVLPWTAPLDVKRSHPKTGEPPSNRIRRELRPVV